MLLLLHLLYFRTFIQEKREPPGPRPVPLFGNLFQVDLRWLDKSLFEVSNFIYFFVLVHHENTTVFHCLYCVILYVCMSYISMYVYSMYSLYFKLSKTHGPVFRVYFGPKQVVVLDGYRAFKQALVNQADEFGTREITPIFYDSQFTQETWWEFTFRSIIYNFQMISFQSILIPGIAFSNGDSERNEMFCSNNIERLWNGQ